MKSSLKSLTLTLLAGAALSACASTVIIEDEETVDTGTTNAEAPEMTAAEMANQQFLDDPRVGLAGGLRDAESAIMGLTMVEELPTPIGFYDPKGLWDSEESFDENGNFRGNPFLFANTDIAFKDDYIITGSYHGFNIFEKTGEGKLDLKLSVACPGGQGDVSIHGDLVFMSVEENRARLDCGGGGVEGDVSPERFRGVRIFDISDFDNPVQIAAVQTCRGSHTHTLVPNKADPSILYVYNQGISGIRPGDELSICSRGAPADNPDTALYSIDVIEVPLDAPENARIVNRPRIFADRETGKIDGLWAGGAAVTGGQRTAPTNHCHDVTVYPEMDLAAGACSGNGILLDISDPVNPKRIDDIFDSNMAYWHSATFNNDASKVLFADEWSGGVGPRCTEKDPRTWGADLIATLKDGELELQGFYKIPTVQSVRENCVSHNGSMIPVPGRDLMVQGWYQGGLSVFDFTDPKNVQEIGFFDRGPVLKDRLTLGGYWSVYWYNGQIYGTEIARGFDVFRLAESDMLSENEIKAAELVMMDEFNPQTQTKFQWPDHPAVAGAYMDQLDRSGALPGGVRRRLSRMLDRWDAGEGMAAADVARITDALAEIASDGDEMDAMRAVELSKMLTRAAG